MYKCFLTIGSSQEYECTDDLVNWNDVTLAFQRKDMGGIIRSYSSDFRFCGQAYQDLFENTIDNGMAASANIRFQLLVGTGFEDVFNCALDYSTFTQDGTTCTINAIDGSIAAKLKANGKTKYQIPALDVNAGTLIATRIMMQNTINYIDGGAYGNGVSVIDVQPMSGGTPVATFPLYISTSEIALVNFCEAYDQSQRQGTPKAGEGFFKVIRPMTLNLKISGRLVADAALSVILYKFDYISSTYSVVRAWDISAGGSVTINYDDDFEITTNDEYFLCTSYNGNTATRIVSYNFKMSASFNGQGDAKECMLASPQTLGQKLLRLATGNNSATIAFDILEDRFDFTRLLCADSARGRTDAKFYTTWDDFCMFMATQFGCIPLIDEEDAVVTFKDRARVYNMQSVYNFDDCNNLVQQANSDMVYSAIRVGYNKVDYDKTNGLDEFRFGITYNTGLTLTDNVLELICPYRADAYGIEYLFEKREAGTTDDESDDDIFLVACYLSSSAYIPLANDGTIRAQQYPIVIEGMIDDANMWNAMYAQTFMVEANKEYLGIFTNILTPTAIEGNGSVTIDGVGLDEPIELDEGLFLPYDVSIDTTIQNMHMDFTKKFSFDVNGRTYTGYLKEAKVIIGQESKVTYKLHLISVT